MRPESAGAVRRLLAEIADNLSYSWTPAARLLFDRLDPELFVRVEHNPKALLARIGDDRLGEALARPGYVDELVRVHTELEAEANGAEGRWWRRERAAEAPDLLVAYFSTEFGIDESLPIYSGGLGVLAGDHLKSAAELGVPLVGVGLLYREGYFRQALDETGRQVERYPVTPRERLPIRLATDERGAPVEIEVEVARASGGLEHVTLHAWRARVGAAKLLLLDSDVEGNSPEARTITDRLYGGDRHHRVAQEVVLGVGGVRMLRALGLRPTVWHMNEGHSAFLLLERIRELVAQGLPRDEAFAAARASTVFTTHTPVPAGNEVFDPELLRRHVGELVRSCGWEWNEFVSLGRIRDGDLGFGMTPFALRGSRYANAVSELHGSVSREMWRDLWPDRPVDEVPIGAITNGVHTRTWLGRELGALLAAHGVRPDAEPERQGWEKVYGIPDEELWAAHCARKRRLVEFAGRRYRRQLGGEGTRLEIDPDALTLGFARRFATYKRAGLLFADPERLFRLLGDDARPVQILFAGKAHPADEEGKDLVQRVVQFTHDPQTRGRIVFIEDYEMTLAKYLVQGVDVWLNTPRRPMEASGTSGMKAALNGVLNCSVRDGWWAEGFDPRTGFAIGGEWHDSNTAAQDAADAEALFWVLEHYVVPTFYDRDARGLPARWIEMMKASIAEHGRRFNTNRMVFEYVEELYLPTHREALVEA
jgi:starch phosphorylase